MSRQLIDTVRSQYGAIAESGRSTDNQAVRTVAEAFGYSPQELSAIPAEANMGLSCGNPTAFAGLRPGEVVVDLGCGGGLDVFLAAARVGPTGRVIGVDMTPQMIELARKNAAEAGGGRAPANVEFHLATIDRLPLPDESVDVIISNCVINLAPDKAAVFREAARVLKPGGRLAISDIALKKSLPPELAASVAAYVGCIAGALPIEQYGRLLGEAGFDAVRIIDSGADLNAYAKAEGVGCATDTMPGSCCGGPSACCSANAAGTAPGGAAPASLLDGYDVNAYAASVKVFAVKSKRRNH